MSWLFAYGDLMGEVDLRKQGARPARLPGYRRSFNHASTRLWGSPQNPCPLLGLSAGGECWGLAFEAGFFAQRALLRRLQPAESPDEFSRIRVPIELADGRRADAVAFVTDAKVPARWNGDGSIDRALLAAHGLAGRGVEYVRTIAHALKLWEMSDPLIESTWKKLEDWRPR